MIETFARAMAGICSRSPAADGWALRWTVIANPRAGGFTIAKRWKRHEAALNTALQAAGHNPVRADARPSRAASSGAPGSSGEFGLALTAARGHAEAITRELVQECSAEAGTFHLVITAGGDGTSLETLSTIYAAPEEIRRRFAVLRLPMGTGNDSADFSDLGKTLELLIRPVKTEKTRGIRLTTASGKTWPGGKPLLAFNILSVGLDAFVTRMTNKMKSCFPGDSYKFWVDVAALLYDRFYTVGPMSIQGYDERGAPALNAAGLFLLCAMGISGQRTYGSQKKILPDSRNVCLVTQMPLARKLAMKGLFTTGGHVGKPELVMANAVRLVISGEYPVLAQMDGETILIEKNDFPVVMELTEPAVQVLRGEMPPALALGTPVM
jgi:diacylglycerol kinase family enzyme